MSVIDVVRGAGTVCTFERKQLRRAAERHRTGGGLSKVAGRIKAQWSSCNWVIFGQVDHWKSLKLCRGRWLCQLWSPFKSSGSTLWKWKGGLLNSVLPSRISRLHCPHIFSSLFLCLKMLQNFPEANMGVSPMKRREASEVKLRRVTTGRAKRAFRQILIYQYNIINQCNYNWRWGVSLTEQDMGSSTSPWLICGNGEWVYPICIYHLGLPVFHT